VLDDRAYRLAPVTQDGARTMLRSVAALTVAMDHADPSEEALDRLAALVSATSRVVTAGADVGEVDIRHVHQRSGAEGSLGATDISVVVSPSSIAPEPTARRM